MGLFVQWQAEVRSPEQPQVMPGNAARREGWVLGEISSLKAQLGSSTGCAGSGGVTVPGGVPEPHRCCSLRDEATGTVGWAGSVHHKGLF